MMAVGDQVGLQAAQQFDKTVEKLIRVLEKVIAVAEGKTLLVTVQVVPQGGISIHPHDE